MRKPSWRVALLCIAALHFTRAETVSWLGITDDWENPANWSTNRVPWADDDVRIDGASTPFAPKLYFGAIVDLGSLVLTGPTFTIGDPVGFGILDIRHGLMNTGQLKTIQPEVVVSDGVVAGSFAFGTLDLYAPTTLRIAAGEFTSVQLLNLSAESPAVLSLVDGQLSDLQNTRIRLFADATGGTGSYIPGLSFDFTSGNFIGATLDYLPSLPSQYSWDTSRFFSEGVITIVPEPSTVALLACSLLVLLGRMSRRAEAGVGFEY